MSVDHIERRIVLQGCQQHLMDLYRDYPRDLNRLHRRLVAGEIDANEYAIEKERARIQFEEDQHAIEEIVKGYSK